MEKGEKRKLSLIDILPILLCGMTIPLSLFLWLFNLAFASFSSDIEYTPIPPTRWLFSTLVPLILMLYGLKRKGVNKSGAAFGLASAFILSIASHAFLACLAAFFFTSSRATRFRSYMKCKIETDFKGGEGKRNWIQVLCNAGMATQLALLYLLDCGSGENPIDFGQFYRASWLGIGIMSAFACCNGDTWASELGSVLGQTKPFLITTQKSVPRGTNGGVTFIGILMSFFGGLAIGFAYYLTIFYCIDSSTRYLSPPQWPLIPFGGLAGLIGSLIDSIIGATFQYSGQDENGRIVERPGANVKHISGYRILDNHSVNLISSILTGLIMPILAIKCWPSG